MVTVQRRPTASAAEEEMSNISDGENYYERYFEVIIHMLYVNRDSDTILLCFTSTYYVMNE